uniref:Tripartite motif containing 35 n=1 Tax=Xenopus tropicalis TaxID=8364 RepID=A0A803JGP9_XENTR
VTLPCGHNFCRSCIVRTWDEWEEIEEELSCPECRERYRRRPELKLNLRLHNIVEICLPSSPSQGDTRILCCQCDPPVRATKSCDLAFMCESCSLSGGHRGHRVQWLDEASEAKKGKLTEIIDRLISEKQKTHTKIHNLDERRKQVEQRAESERQQMTELFREIRQQLDALEEKIMREMYQQKKKDFSNHVTVLREQEVEAEALCGAEEEEEDNVADGKKFSVVSDMGKWLISGKLSAAIADVTNVIDKVGIYGREATGLSLDTDTASNNLALSHNRKSVSHTDTRQNLPQTPGRFQEAQALGTRSFSSGKHYWEVEGSETGGWRIGVAYPSIDREGDQSYIGFNNKSWALCKFYNNYSVIHNGERKGLAMPPSCQRIRIFLNYEAGCLSFYELSYPIRCLHTFTVPFSEHKAAG